MEKIKKMKTPRKWRSNHGAVSVFLALILVPCIVVTSVFVDVGRVKLANDLAEAAGDLALNSLLTRYDHDLSDFYGLVASCQSIEEFYSTSSDYFLRLLQSQGLSEEEKKGFVSQIGAAFEGSPFHDMLRMELVSDMSSLIVPVEGANLENPAIVKEQIMEFMKYRAPINITAGLLGKLFENKDDAKKLEAQEKDKELTDKMRESYEAENELMEEAFKIYDSLYAYQHLDPADPKPEEGKNASANKIKRINQTVNRLNSYRDVYKQIHEALVHDLFNTEGLGRIEKKVYATKERTLSSPFSAEKTSTLGQMKPIMISLAQAIADYTSSKAALENVFPDYNNAIYDIQYWAQNSSEISSKLKSLNGHSDAIMDNWAKLKNAYEFLAEGEDTGVRKLLFTGYSGYAGNTYEMSYQWHYDKLCAQAESIFNTILSRKADNENDGDKYIKFISIIQRISTNENNLKAVKSDSRMVPLTEKSVDETVKKIYDEITADRAVMEAHRDALKGVPDKLNKLKDLLKSYKEAFDTWEKTADAAGTDLAGEHQKDIAKEKANKKLEELTDVSIDKLKTRIENMIALYDDLIEAIDSIKYGNAQIKNIKTTQNAKDASGIKKDKIETTKDALRAYADSSFSFTPAEGDAADIPVKDANHPNLYKKPVPALYAWMDKNFEALMDSSARKDHDEKEKEFEGYQQESGTGNGKSENEEKEQEADGVTENNIKGYGEGFTVLTFFGSIVDLFVNIVDNGVEAELSNCMEALYATEYVTGMFSSYTSDKEMLYNLADNESGTKGDGKYKDRDITISLMKDTIKKDFENRFETSSGQWTDVSPVLAKNRSLTTKPINEKTNWAHGAEWEYILFGHDKSQDNVNAALTGMYAVRFICNIPSAFKFFWNEGNPVSTLIEATANAISTATAGIVPAALVKAVLIIVLAILETINDVNLLKAGIPVKFLKWGSSSEPDPEWVVSLTLGEGSASLEKNDSGKKKGLFLSYNDILYIFLLLGFHEDSLAPDMYVRTARVIEANLNYLIDGNGEGDKFQLSRAHVHFEITATLRVDPLLLSLPFSQGYDSIPQDKTDWHTFNYKATRGYS